jgi:hypothetical protein
MTTTTLDDAADRGRRIRVADLAWRLEMWAADAERCGQPDQALAYEISSKEVERLGTLCWSDFDVEIDRHPSPMIR